MTDRERNMVMKSIETVGEFFVPCGFMKEEWRIGLHDALDELVSEGVLVMDIDRDVDVFRRPC